MIKLYAGVSMAAQHICKSLAPVDLIAIMLLRQPLRGLVHSSCYVVFVFIPTFSDPFVLITLFYFQHIS